MAETATVEILMPAMGESVSEGTVLEWHVSEGESVEEGQTVVEVSTDKVDAEVPAPASGTITEILVQPDEEVAVGAALAKIESGEGPAAASDGAGEAQTEPEPADSSGGNGGDPSAEQAEAPTATADAPATTDDASVAAGETTAEGALQV